MNLTLFVSWLCRLVQRARKSDLPAEGIRSVVLIELTRLGDVVTVLPAIQLFRRHYPGAIIHVVVKASYAPLLSTCEPSVNTIGVRDSASFSSLLRILRSIRSLNPDLACSMSPSNRNALLALASGSRFAVGYMQGSGSVTPFLGMSTVDSIGFKTPGDVMFGQENIEARPWKVLQALGIREQLSDASLWRKGIREDNLMARLPLPQVVGTAPYVVLHPFSGWKFRSWPLSNFETFARRMLQLGQYDIVFLCHRSEQTQLAPLQRSFAGQRRVRFFPSSDILETAALLRSSSLFIGNDSGPLHLAAWLGAPLVGLYGPAAPSLTAPLSSGGKFLYHEVPCSPCAQTRCRLQDYSCMQQIPVEAVISAAVNELEVNRTREIAAHE